MVLVTGSTGQLGFDIIRELNKRCIKCIGVGRNDLDITDNIAVSKYVLDLKPSCIIHCAAYTSVDNAEDNKELCYKVNVVGTENISKACKDIDAKMIYISTDYVFNGEGDIPFEVDGNTNPISIYGQSKYEGELKVKGVLDKYFIVRVSWIFGENGSNFVKTMLNLGRKRESLNVVCDQIGSPTYTKDLALVLCDMVKSERYGVYHATNEGFCSWAEFASEIMKKAKLHCKIIPISTSEYIANAKRPLNSRLSKKSLINNGFRLLPDWKNALDRFLVNYNN